MKSVFTVGQIRRAEERLFEVQNDPDELMISAAAVVADVAAAMVDEPVADDSGENHPGEDRILLLVGAGGNGGDALYAGAFLREEGYQVDALLLGGGRVQESALRQFRHLGGTVVDTSPHPASYHLVIDGILGIGGRGGIDADTAQFVERIYSAGVPILSVDVPSGIDADTGAVPEPIMVQLAGYADGAPIARQCIPTHITADVTVTFGGLRRAHAVSTACGYVLCADIRVEGGGGLNLSTALQDIQFKDAGPTLYASTAWRDVNAEITVPGASPIGAQFIMLDVEPAPDSDKYTGGVVGIVAGSEDYPGAAILACAGAVRATSSMVRFVGDNVARNQVVAALPEVVVSSSVEETGRVQAWVYGPGRGTGADQVAELAGLLDRPEPVLIDADGITLIARSPELRSTVCRRSSPIVLTPHKGEFERLAEPLRTSGATIPSADADPIGATLAMAAELDCCVLLKGRSTIVATTDYVYVVNAGHSWSATPGSGDVLSGLIGAHLAQSYVELTRLPEFIPDMELPPTAVYSLVAPAVSIHAVAAALSARTEFGPAPTSASRIAESISAATARVNINRIMND